MGVANENPVKKAMNGQETGYGKSMRDPSSSIQIGPVYVEVYKHKKCQFTGTFYGDHWKEMIDLCEINGTLFFGFYISGGHIIALHFHKKARNGVGIWPFDLAMCRIDRKKDIT